MAGYQPTAEALRTIHSGRRGAPIGSEEIQTIVHDMIKNAEDFVDLTLAPEREEATNFYQGKAMPVPAGRSSIEMTEVRDIVHTLIPGLMRVFTGSEHAVEFVPVEESDVDNAEQATDYVDHVFSKDNDGFMIIYGMALDGLVKKSGIAKWWYEEATEVFEETYTGLTQGQVGWLAQQPDVEITSAELMQPGQEQDY